MNFIDIFLKNLSNMQFNIINSYTDIINESVFTSADTHSDLIECVSEFLEVQDELPEYNKLKNGDIELIFCNNGYDYKFLFYIENAKIRMKGVYRHGGDLDIEINMDAKSFETSLKTRYIYPKMINKITRIIKVDF